MPDTKISALTNSTNAPADTDVFVTVENMGTVPATFRKAWSIIKAAKKAYTDTFYIPNNGWTPAGTFTYASAVTITVASGAALIYTVGDKIKLTDAAATKYFYIITVADTLLTVTGGSDYTLSGGAITNPFYSHAITPIGFPDWFNLTVTHGGFSANPPYVARFNLKGRMCTFVYCIINPGTGNSNAYSITLPITATTIANMQWYNAVGFIYDNSLQVAAGYASIQSAGTTVSVYKNGSAAWTNAAGKGAVFQIAYEI
jgi:hypothetical protein